MNKFLIVILSLFLFVCFVQAEPLEFIYSDWIDYYPEGVEEYRIESQDRYRWFKIEDEQRIETSEYYDYLEGYERIDESLKTFYRVINNEYIILNSRQELVRDTEECRKVFCIKIKILPFIPNEPTEPPEEEIITNPDTFDPLYLYYFSLIVCVLIIILINHRKINLVLSNHWN